MATQNIVAYGGRAGGGSTVQLDSFDRQVANNVQQQSPATQATGENVMNLPILDAAAMDRLFGLMTDRANAPVQTGQGETAEWTTPEQKLTLDSIGAASQSADQTNRDAYAGLGWNLGWNTAATAVKRGSAAFGLKENPTFKSDMPADSHPIFSRKYENLDKIAEFAKIDSSQYKNPDGSLNESQLKAAVDNALKDYYLVSGDTNGIPGQTGKPFEYASSLYKRDGDKLTPISGTQQRFMAPENSNGHFQDELAAPLSVLLAPILSGFGITGAAGSLTTGISNATGLSPFWSNVIGQAGIRGGMAAASGGDFIRGAAAGAVGTAAPSFIGQGADALAGAGTAGANALNVAGRLGLSAALNGGNLSPLAIVGTLVDTLGGKQGNRNRTSK